VQNVLFVSIVTVVLASTHGYLWLRLVHDPALAQPLRRIATIALIVLPSALLLSFFVRRAFSPGAARWLTAPVYVWAGLFFLLFAGLVATDLLRLLLWMGACVAASDGAPDPERRVWIAEHGLEGSRGEFRAASGRAPRNPRG